MIPRINTDTIVIVNFSEKYQTENAKVRRKKLKLALGRD